MDKIKIFTVYHKLFQFLPDTIIFQPIHAGKEIAKISLPFPGDNSKIHISDKNKFLCELTVLYWIWKNIFDLDYVGIAHYRRIWLFKTGKPHLTYNLTKETIKLSDYLDNAYLNQLLLKYDYIVPIPFHLKETLKDSYAKTHIAQDWDILVETLIAIYPETQPYINQFNKSKIIYPFNMFICSKKKFDDYMKWLWPIIEILTTKINTSRQDLYQNRSIGFLAERIFTLYIMIEKSKGKKIKELGVMFIDEANINLFRFYILKLERFFLIILYKLSPKLYHFIIHHKIKFFS